MWINVPPSELHKQECLRCLHARLRDAVLIVFRGSNDIIYNDGDLQDDVIYKKIQSQQAKKKKVWSDFCVGTFSERSLAALVVS